MIGACAAAAVLAVGFAFLAPWLFSSNTIRATVSSRLQTLSGLYVVARGDARLALLPRPHLMLESVALADRNGALTIEAPTIFGPLNLMALLAGQLDMSAVQLVRPRIVLDREKTIDAPGVATRAAAARPATPEAQSADRALLGIISIVDGDVRLTGSGQTYSFGKVNASLEWRRIGEPFALNGSFHWRGERLEALLWIARPGEMLRGGESIVTARLDGDNIRLQAQGHAEGWPSARFSGHIGGSADSARRMLQLVDLASSLPGSFAQTQFSSQAVITARDVNFQDLHLITDGNEFEGAIRLRRDEGRFGVTADLRSEFVSAKAMLSDAPNLMGSDGQWGKEPFDVPDLSGMDLDLRLSAARARLGRLAFDNAIFTATLRDGSLDLGVSEAQAYKGAMKLRAAFTRAAEGLAIRADAQAVGMDAGALLRDAFGRRAFAGALDTTVSVDASGADMMALMRSLKGRVTATLVDGEIDGLDLERALRKLDKRPLASALDIRAGRTTLEKAALTLLIENGVGEIKDGAAQGAGYSLGFSGLADIAERTLDLRAVAEEALGHKDLAAAPRHEKKIAFDVAGTWDDLRLTTDAQAFIRRSDAAAPLLPPRPEAEQPSAAAP